MVSESMIAHRCAAWAMPDVPMSMSDFSSDLLDLKLQLGGFLRYGRTGFLTSFGFTWCFWSRLRLYLCWYSCG